MDPRATQLAEIIVNHSVRVEKDSKVVIDASDFSSLDLIKECYRLSLEKGAEVYLDILGTNFSIGRADYGGLFETFLETATPEQLQTPPELMQAKLDWGDKFIRIVSIHNRSYLAGANAKKLAQWRNTYYPVFETMINKDWLLTYWPTVGTAQNANMSLQQFTDYYFRAAIIDYAEQGKEIKKLTDILDAGETVEITGDGIDLQLGIKDRLFAGAISGTHNIPDGEAFAGPEEDKTEGYVEFEYPQIRDGNEVSGIRLEFEQGEIVNYSAETNQEFLDEVFSDHEGNRRLGELGIGMNRGITSYIKDILFDEKIYGTVHFAVGKSYEYERGGGKNPGTIHWDMIKDLRHQGSELKVDGKVIFRDGKLVVS